MCISPWPISSKQNTAWQRRTMEEKLFMSSHSGNRVWRGEPGREMYPSMSHSQLPMSSDQILPPNSKSVLTLHNPITFPKLRFWVPEHNQTQTITMTSTYSILWRDTNSEQLRRPCPVASHPTCPLTWAGVSYWLLPFLTNVPHSWHLHWDPHCTFFTSQIHTLPRPGLPGLLLKSR